MAEINGYPSLYQFGHKEAIILLELDVIVEEKVDGSQFSFRKEEDGSLFIRSKNVQLQIGNDNHMFNKAVEVVQKLAPELKAGYTYRGEYLQKPKHNALAYDRHPKDHIILFDIERGLGDFLDYYEKEAEAQRLGLEVVPILYAGKISSADQLKAILDTTSILGGQKLEGVVLKPIGYNLYGRDKKVIMCKYVSEAFKEVHKGEWRKSNPNKKDLLTDLILQYRTPARWNKAIQHLRDAGQLENSPKDIGKLMKEVGVDILKECKEDIMERLFKHFWGDLQRGLTNGLPEYYKEYLLNQTFEEVKANEQKTV